MLEFDKLDNEKLIYSQSSEELIKILYDFPKQFKKAEGILRSLTLKFEKGYRNVLILGVGNPATTVYRLMESVSSNNIKVPISMSSSKELPTWIGKDTLVVAISHSVNTR